MKTLCDYMIIKRNGKGFGVADFCGKFNNEDNKNVVVRIIREDDNLTVCDWQLCELNNENWNIKLSIPEGGLYRIEAREIPDDKINYPNRYDWCNLVGLVKHIGVGEVYVLAGQSNMSGYGRDFAYDPIQLGVHLYNNRGEWEIASHPFNSIINTKYCNNEGGSSVSPGLSFARTMSNRLKVPVGVVIAAEGGSLLEAWNPNEEDCYLYNEMVNKVEDVGDISGIIWYQGCSDADELETADTYYDRFCTAVSSWREKFGNVPIVTCQMNRHAWKGGGDDRFWGIIREAQRQAARNLENVFIVPTMDMFTNDGIHNSSASCVIVGERIANVFLHGFYGQPGFFAPSVKSVKKLNDRSVFISFDNKHNLRTMDDIATGINVEDESGLIDCEKACLYNDGILVTTERDIVGNAKFHAYWRREVPAFYIRDTFGFPMLSCYNVKIEY